MNQLTLHKVFNSGDTLAIYHKGYEYLFSKLINITTFGKFDHLLKLYRPDEEGVWVSEQTVSHGCVYQKITWKKFIERFLSDKVNVYHGEPTFVLDSLKAEEYAKETELQKYGFGLLLDEAPILNLYSPFSKFVKRKEICSMHVVLSDEKGFANKNTNDNPFNKIIEQYGTISPAEYVKSTISNSLYTWYNFTEKYKDLKNDK